MASKSFILHLIASAVFGFCTYYDTNHLFVREKHEPEYEVAQMLMQNRERYGGRWKYLTIWGLTAQLLYYLVAMATDMSSGSDASRLRRFRDIFFTTIALPVALQVSVMFWTLYFIDRDLVFPTVLDGHYPVWLNHGVHTMPALLGALEIASVRHKFTTIKQSLTLLTAFLGSYLCWTLYLALVCDLWVYGIMQVLSWPARIGFMAANLAITLAFFFVGRAGNRLIWGTDSVDAENGATVAKKRR